MQLHPVITKIQEHMWLGNGDQCYLVMYTIARTFQVKSVLEIGTHQGASAIAFCEAIIDNGDNPKITTVDNWCGIPGQKNDFDYKVMMKKRALGFFRDAGYVPYITMIEGDSKIILPEVFQQIGRVDLCFIDGNHEPEYVISDFNNCKEHTNLMLFHDCYEEEYMKVFRQEGWTAVSFPTRWRQVEGGNDSMAGITLILKDASIYGTRK